MKHFKLLLILVALLALDVTASSAQEVYTINGTANQVSTLTRVVDVANRRTCERLNAVGAPACSQANACIAANAAGGSGCTAAQARAANARIYPATQAGREEFITFAWVAPRFQDAVGDITARDLEECKRNWSTLTNTEKDGVCSNAHLTTGWVAGTGGCQVCQ